jgi:hypothetical protein
LRETARDAGFALWISDAEKVGGSGSCSLLYTGREPRESGLFFGEHE